MAYFSKKIICLKCNKRFKFKRERKTNKYIDSTYDNKGASFCDRTVIEESFLLDLIERRYKKKFTEGEIQSIVEKIEVKSKYEFIIYFYNDEPIVSMDGLFKF